MKVQVVATQSLPAGLFGFWVNVLEGCPSNGMQLRLLVDEKLHTFSIQGFGVGPHGFGEMSIVFHPGKGRARAAVIKELEKHGVISLEPLSDPIPDWR